MKQKINISIPEPCHEDWNNMTPTQKGRFCGVCTKEVVDFTSFSDEQLIKHLNREQHLCGRFNKQQLNRDLVLDRKNRSSFSSFVTAGLFSLFLFNSNGTKAQEKPKTEQTDKKYISIPLINTLAKDSITVSGTVLDENNYPLPGATILIKRSETGTSTDFDGVFSLKCKKNDLIKISYVGYETKYVKTTQIDSITLNPDNTLDEVIVIVGGISVKKRWIGGNLFTRFTNIFRKEKKNPKFR
ncbi:carboxypeptidase-like regulatory domain-containing protein [Pseudofulvibacter geojedonensis]|uniref:Carboxypeptidase-like regulatory domain-containing protein n=1 Tax=Pseudofulvibacter geojedonensis TaxID=1123758 RepID=A0ABW3HYU5_9FLAO